VRTIVKGKNLDVRDEDRRYVEHKVDRLTRVLDGDTDVLVELAVEHHRSDADSHIVDVTLVLHGRTVRGVASAPTHRAAMDEVVDKLERQAVDQKTRPRARASGEKPLLRSLREEPTVEPSGRRDDADGVGPRIVKTKRFAIEPMFAEDAVSRMEELGHAFFVFVDAETERMAVLYRRADGDYGVIEPSMGGGYSGAGRRR
jgi:putative sigma-54 modulation protein